MPLQKPMVSHVEAWFKVSGVSICYLALLDILGLLMLLAVIFVIVCCVFRIG